jgi:hypothetical protein
MEMRIGMGTSKRRNLRALGMAVALCAGILSAGSAFGQTIPLTNKDTFQDFTSAGQTPYTGSTSTGALPSVQPPNVPAPPNGKNYYRLLQTSDIGVTNTAAFDRSFVGGFTQVVTDFDFRIVKGTGSGEGFGFALLNTGWYGWTGPLNDAAEEPNFINSLGIGFDVNQNAGDISGDSVSVHWSKTDATAGTTASVTQQFDLSATTIPDMASGQWIHVTITANASVVPPTVTIALTPQGGSTITLVANVSNLVPYETRAYFAARSSTNGAEYGIANVNIHYVSDPAVLGKWGAVQPLPIIPIHSVLLPTGHIICWDRSSNGAYDPQPRLLNPVPWTVTTTANLNAEIFCSAMTLRHDGKMLQAGGHLSEDDDGRKTTYLYDEGLDKWTQLQDMNAGRWYPSLVNLNNGDTLVWSGYYSSTPGTPGGTISINGLPQVISGTTGLWRDLSSAVDYTPLFPMFHLAPNGMVVRTGPVTDTKYLDTSNFGTWGPSFADTGAPVVRDYGNSVMYDVGKILLAGGGQNPCLRSVQIIDLTVPTPAWTTVDPMSFARRHCSSLLLPDGTILTTGGTSTGTGVNSFNDATLAVFAAELWNPTSLKWTVMAGAAVDRIYHSETILIPDGRVVSLGGGHPAASNGGTDNYNGEIYSPPYLFKGPRPTLSAAPPFVQYGQVFTVSTPDGASITDVTLLAPNAMTHATDMNQRILHPGFSIDPGGQSLTVTAPSDNNLCPPGYYTLWLLANGIPSQAKFIHINVNTPPVANATVTGGLAVEATSAAGASVSLDGSGSTDLEGTALTYQWSEGPTALGTGMNLSRPLSIGTHMITLQVTDSGNPPLTASTTITVTVSDTTPPVFQTLGATPSLLRSVSNGLVGITVSATATDLVDPSPTFSVTTVTSTEVDPGPNPGDQSPDFVITPPMGLQLRSERFTYVRVYTVTVQAKDASNNTSTSTVPVRVRGKWFP